MDSEIKLDNNNYQYIMEKVEECKKNGTCSPVIYRIINEVDRNTTKQYQENVQDQKTLTNFTNVPIIGYYGADGTFIKN